LKDNHWQLKETGL